MIKSIILFLFAVKITQLPEKLELQLTCLALIIIARDSIEI